jgi:transposase
MDIAQRPQPTVILAEDEASLYLQASQTYVWSPRGHTPVVRIHTNRDSTHVYGSLNLLTGQETVMRSQKMNSDTTALYLQHILCTYPDQPIVLLWDRAPHHKGDAVKAVLAAHPRLEVMWLPAGAPDTNPQEHVWKDMRQHVCHGHMLHTLACLADAAERHLRSHTFPSSLLHTHAYPNVCAMFI